MEPENQNTPPTPPESPVNPAPEVAQINATESTYFQLQSVSDNAAVVTPSPVSSMSTNAVKKAGKFAPWMTIVGIIALLLIILVAGFIFVSGNKQSLPFSSLISEKCSLDISKESTAKINSLSEISGCVKEYTDVVEPSQDNDELNANYYTKITYKFNALPGANLHEVPTYSMYDATSNTLTYTSKASPDSMARIEYSIKKSILSDDSSEMKGEDPSDTQKIFLDEVEIIQNEDKGSLDHFISSNGYDKISITSEKKKISDKTYLITSRSTYSWGEEKKITAHNDIQRVVSMQAVKFTTWNEYTKSNFDDYELELLDIAVKAEHLEDSLYNNDKKYLDQIADKMTKDISIKLEMVGEEAKMEIID